MTTIAHARYPDPGPQIAGARLVALSSAPDPHWAAVVIRLATSADRRALEVLAELDSAQPPAGESLIGEVLGRPVAALSLNDGKVIADPFVAASDVVDLLRLRARQLQLKTGGGGRRRPARRG